MNKTQFFAAIAAAGAVTLSAMPAFAEVVLRDAENNVYVAGLSPGTGMEVGFSGAGARTRSVEADRCGTIKISPSLVYAAATKIEVGGTTSNLADLPTATPGKCTLVNGAYTSQGQPQATRYKDAIGAVYIQGLQPKQDITVSYPDLPVTRKYTANACGYFRVTNSDQSPITNTTSLSFDMDGTAAVGSLKTVTAPSCRRVSDTASKMMVPVDEANFWTGAR